MTKICVITDSILNDDEKHLFHSVTRFISKLDYEVITRVLSRKNISLNEIGETLDGVDVLIPFITVNAVNSNLFLSELSKFLAFAKDRKSRLILPIFVPGLELQNVPEILIGRFGIYVRNFNEEDFVDSAVNIHQNITQFLERKALEENSIEIKHNIETSAPDYIANTLIDLKKSEASQKNTALFWYTIGFLAFIAGIIMAIIFSNNGLHWFNGRENWSLTIFFAIKNISIIVLLIAASKYSFSLAKSFMSESLKIADRIHAISFGKFYLEVFKENINPTEIKEIFRDWNINNTTNSFSTQSSNDYDPRILDHLKEIVEKIRNQPNK